MHSFLKKYLILLAVVAVTSSLNADVAIYTAQTNWTSVVYANQQARLCAERLEAIGVTTTLFRTTNKEQALADWLTAQTDDGDLDVLILFGFAPGSIYGSGNTQPDGSPAELFIESTDGDTIINHGDYIFYVSDPPNTQHGLQNITDLENIAMGGENHPMEVTELGLEIAPSLRNFVSDRPLHTAGLGGDWFVEAALAQNPDGTLVDPAIIRDGDRGRIVTMFQAIQQDDPMGAVASEVVAWLLGEKLEPTSYTVLAPTACVVAAPIKLSISVIDDSGTITGGHPIDVNLKSSSPTGAFDVSPMGEFDGSKVSFDVPDDGSISVYYKDMTPGDHAITVSNLGLPALEHEIRDITVFEDLSGNPGKVAIYTGNVSLINQEPANIQAQICADQLNPFGISTTIFQDPAETEELAHWVSEATNNGVVDALVLFGYLPDTLYAPENAEADGSIIELFIESTDGDVIINHGDYMFFVSSALNKVGGLQNIMDIPNIHMWGKDNSMVPTELGSHIAPSLVNFQSDRPFHVDHLEGDWFVEAALAEDAANNLADPVIVRDGNRGRLVPIFQTAFQDDDPKGAVAAEVIKWLLTKSEEPPLFRRGDVDGNGMLEMTDPINVLLYQFQGLFIPVCLDAADFDDNGKVEITDAISSLSHQFLGTVPPALPGKSTCGLDPTPDAPEEGGDLGCLEPPTNC